MRKKNKHFFYGIRLKNSRYEKIHNDLLSLEQQLNHLLFQYKINFFFETIAEKIVLLDKIIEFKEYIR